MVFTFLAGCTKENASNGDNSASGKGGSLAKFTLSGNYLYVVDNSVLYTYDVSDSKNPVLQDQTYIDATSETIFPYKDKLFIGTTTGMFIYAIQQNGRPAYLGSASHVRSCDPVVSNDTVAYVTLSGNNRCGPGVDGLYIHDVRDVLNPKLVKTLEMPTPFGLGLHKNILYVCCKENGLKVFDITKPFEPVLLKTDITTSFFDVIPYNNLLIAYVKEGIALLDITDAANPVFLQHIPH